MAKRKGLSGVWFGLVRMAEQNKESVVTASILLYALGYVVVGIGGISFQFQPATGYTTTSSSNSNPPSGSVWIENQDIHWADGSSEYLGKGEWLIGEAGTFTTNSGNWQNVNFDRDYQNPVVVGSTNTRNGGDDAMIFEAKNVQSNQAYMRVCENENAGGSGCDGHTDERAGYLVIDAAVANDIPGVEAGTFDISGEVDSNTNTISYSESFGSTPNVFLNTQTTNNNVPVTTHITSTSTSSFTAGKCWQDSSDGCDGNQGTETLGYVAIEPGNIPFNVHTEMGSSSLSDSNWGGSSFSSSFSATPAAIVSTQTLNGGQEAEIDEARNVGTGSLDFRFCEYEGGGSCDGHTSETVAWFALDQGLITVNPISSSGPQGSAWINNKYLFWINENGNKARYHGLDTGNNPSGGNPGNTWIENGYLHYIDQNGNERVLNG